MRRAKGKHLEKRGGNILPALCSLIGTLLVLVVIIMLLPVTAPRLIGFQVYNVVSGSMAPAKLLPERKLFSVIYA